MSKSHRLLSPEEEADLKRLMDEYNNALRALPITPYATVFSSMIIGRVLSEKLSDIHPYLPVLFLMGLVAYIFFLILHEKRKRQRSGIRLPWEVKREIKRKYNINLEQARAAFAKTYGPTVLDSLAADNKSRKRSVI